MIWTDLGMVGRYAISVWLLGVFMTVLVQMANGKIILSGILSSHRTGRYGLNRMQMAAVSVLFAGGYAIKALAQPPLAGLPDLPPILLLALVGSQSAYLIGKYRGG